ncbi:MAG TPA: cyclopropane-fatty-acyl-phospholipid synthase family protein [Steroidobacteraceae bacterium]|nr:cyclopropane-fatty-acyl-phospholipid synthase family protein [Steroidobacteraceae bacterium]
MDRLDTDARQDFRPHEHAMEAPARSPRPSMSGRLVRSVLTRLGDPRIEFELWTGERIRTSLEPPLGRLIIRDVRTLREICMRGEVGMGDAYADGGLEVDGDLASILEDVYQHSPRRADDTGRPAAATRRPRRAHRNTLVGSRDNIHHHYDIGNAFYSLWLGETMSYTCAYYPTPDATLDAAQVAKMDHVCRKLRLQPSEHVLEAGFGWGTLATHMASRYGVRVRAYNISEEQVRFARERAAGLGLGRQVEYVHDDYRNATGPCDAFVSVGMLEHVGTENYATLGHVISRCLKPNGRGLVHSIGRNQPEPLHPWIERRIFPGAYPPSLKEMMDIFEPWNLSVLDVENLRLHYARTCRHWLEAFEAARDRVAAMFDERFVRMWRLYLAGSTAAFRTGELQLFQVVFAPGRSNDVPWTRADLYAR